MKILRAYLPLFCLAVVLPALAAAESEGEGDDAATTPAPGTEAAEPADLQAELAAVEAALERKRQTLEGIEEEIRQRPGIAQLREAAAAARRAYGEAREADPELQAAREQEEAARRAYDRALEAAVTADEVGAANLTRQRELRDADFERELRRRVLRERMANERRRVERNDAALREARRNRDRARRAWQRSREEDADLAARRERLAAAERALEELLQRPEIAAAREAVRTARGELRTAEQDHSARRAAAEADGAYDALVEEKLAARARYAELRTEARSEREVEETDREELERLREELGTVRDRVDAEVPEVAAAREAYQAARAHSREMERQEELEQLRQTERQAREAERDAVATARAEHETYGQLRIEIEAARERRRELTDAITAKRLAEKVRPATVPEEGLGTGLLCHVFEVTGDHEDFAATEPLRTVAVTVVDLAPKPAEEDFGLEFTGYLRVTEPGMYRFELNSDDGSALYLNDCLVIDNGGMHGMERMGQAVELVAGLYPLRITYYQGSGGAGLELTVQHGDGEPGPVPPDMLRAPAADLAAAAAAAEEATEPDAIEAPAPAGEAVEPDATEAPAPAGEAVEPE